MNFVPVNEPLLAGNEKAYVTECIETGWISSEGTFVRRFEEEMAARVGRQYGVTVSNGTAALEIALATLNIGAGDEVILPTLTIISCAAAVVRAGATPVVVDAEPDTWNMAVEDIEAKITSRTKAIMVAHLYGLPVEMNKVEAIADRYNLAIIEDAAEMHGQTYRGTPCGSFGTLSTLSFYANKHVTTGEGGMVLTDDPSLAERCRSLRNLCFQPQQRFVHEELGWNYRMSNVQAAIGVAQLEALDDFVQRKRRMGQRYTEAFQTLTHVQLPLAKTDSAENIYWVYGLVLGDSVPFAADKAMKLLKQKGIGTRPFFWCMHEQPVFRKMGLLSDIVCPVAERLARRGFYIPSGLGLTEAGIEQVITAVKEILL
jgi:perosamine synthetase